MNKLELLWKLEKQNTNLDDLIKEIDDLNRDADEVNTGMELKKINRRLEVLDNNRGVIKTAIAKYENSLSQYEYEIKTLDDKLYKDNITDIKQLEYLGFEKEQLKKGLKEVEIEMMAYMEEEEILKKRHTNNVSMLKELEEKINEQSSSGTKELRTLEERLEDGKDDIETITKKLDIDSLKIYNELKDRKDKPIVIVANNICVGCNMKVPMYQLEGLKKKGKIINCESCGRILFLKEE